MPLSQRSFYLEDDLFEELRQIAFYERISLSEVVRRLLRAGTATRGLDQHHPIPPKDEVSPPIKEVLHDRP
jgi:hypothetical protein